MTVISLHELCRRELRALLDMRYMATGWTREGNRKAEVKFNEVHKLLELQLTGLPEHLLVYPTQDNLRARMRIATAERTFEAMVTSYVQQLSTLPVPDQADAYATSELRLRLAYLERVRNELSNTRAALGKTVDSSGVRGVDFDALFEQLDDALEKTKAEYQLVEKTMATYESVL